MTQVPASGRADPLAIEARGIRRTYAAKPRPVEALRGVDLDVRYTDVAVVAALAVTAVAWAAAGLGAYSFFVRRARDRGLIDQLTSS